MDIKATALPFYRLAVSLKWQNVGEVLAKHSTHQMIQHLLGAREGFVSLVQMGDPASLFFEKLPEGRVLSTLNTHHAPC